MTFDIGCANLRLVLTHAVVHNFTIFYASDSPII